MKYKILKLMDPISKALFISFYLTLLMIISFELVPPHSLSWDEIPGNDSDRLVKYLEQNYNVFWIEKPKIQKSDDGATINISDRWNHVSLKLSNEETIANMDITDVRTIPFTVNKENGKLKLYAPPYSLGWDEIPGNDSFQFLEYLKQNYYAIELPKIQKSDDGATINISDGMGLISLKLNNEKTLVAMDITNVITTIPFTVSKENGKLKLHVLPDSLSWDEIPGNDSDRLVKYLEQNYNVLWREKPKIQKSDDGATINISDGMGLISLKLNNGKTSADMTVADVTTRTLFVNKENGKLKLYVPPYLFSWDEIPGNDSGRLIEYIVENYDVPWIILPQIKKSNDNTTIDISSYGISLKLNNDKTLADMSITYSMEDYVFDVNRENGKLKFYVPRYRDPFEQEKKMFPYTVLISVKIILFLSFRDKIFKIENFPLLIKVGKLFPTVPFFMMGVGSAILLSLLSIAFYSDIFDSDIIPLLGVLGIALIFIGFILLIITFFIKKSLERRIYFTLDQAKTILNKIDENNKSPEDIDNLKRYMNLTYKNAKKKLGRGLELKASSRSEKNNLDLDYTLVNYLPYYIEIGGKEQLDSIKTRLDEMSKSVNEKDEIKWNTFAPAILKLNDNIITYLRQINFDLTYRTLPRSLDWIYRNKDMIYKTVGLFIPIILYILTKI